MRIKPNRSFSVNSPSIAYTAKIFIDNHFSRIQDVKQIAGELGIPYERLRKHFPREIGISLRDYLHLTRINEAKKLLPTGVKLYAIAREVGYADEVLLIRHWKRIVGATPAQFKKTQMVEP